MCGILKELANLAAHGHHAGKNPAGKPLEPWQSSMEGLGQVNAIYGWLYWPALEMY